MNEVKLDSVNAINNSLTFTSTRRLVKAENYHMRCRGQCKIVIDCQFNELINERGGKSLARQIMQSYGASRRSDFPIALTLAGLKPGLLLDALSNISGYPNWLFTLTDKPVEELCSRNSTLFLSADSTETLNVIDNDKTYVIGGIVDRNHKKGFFFDTSQRLGFRAVRLPIKENINLIGSHILNVYSVFQIFLNYYEYGGNWPVILINAIPKRKLKNLSNGHKIVCQLKETSDGENSD